MLSPLMLAAASTSSSGPTNREPGIGSSPDIIRSQYRLHPVRWLPGLVARHRHGHTQRLPNMNEELDEKVGPKIIKSDAKRTWEVHDQTLAADAPAPDARWARPIRSP